MEEKNNAIGTLRSRLADLQQKVTVKDQQKEALEEMNCQIFLLRSKLSSHEMYFNVLKEKLVSHEATNQVQNIAEIETNIASENEKNHDESFESCNGLKNYKKNERLSILIRKHQARKIIRFQCRQCFKWFPSKKRRNKHITMLHKYSVQNRDVTTGKI